MTSLCTRDDADPATFAHRIHSALSTHENPAGQLIRIRETIRMKAAIFYHPISPRRRAATACSYTQNVEMRHLIRSPNVNQNDLTSFKSQTRTT